MKKLSTIHSISCGLLVGHLLHAQNGAVFRSPGIIDAPGPGYREQINRFVPRQNDGMPPILRAKFSILPFDRPVHLQFLPVIFYFPTKEGSAVAARPSRLWEAHAAPRSFLSPEIAPKDFSILEIGDGFDLWKIPVTFKEPILR